MARRNNPEHVRVTAGGGVEQIRTLSDLQDQFPLRNKDKCHECSRLI